MLNTVPVHPTIPVTDIARAKEFYEKKLGLTLSDESEGDLTFEAGEGTKLYLYKRGPSKADHTLAGFVVPNIEDAVKDLSSRGVTFEQYDIPGFIKTNEQGISDMEGEKAAWFKDPDGNILAVSQRK